MDCDIYKVALFAIIGLIIIVLVSYLIAYLSKLKSYKNLKREHDFIKKELLRKLTKLNN